MMNLDPALIAVCLIGFGLHVGSRFKERKTLDPFLPWLKSDLGYFLGSMALVALGLIMRYEIMDLVGMTKPLTYVLAVSYGGGHVVAKALGMKEGAEDRKMLKKGQEATA